MFLLVLNTVNNLYKRCHDNTPQYADDEVHVNNEIGSFFILPYPEKKNMLTGSLKIKPTHDIDASMQGRGSQGTTTVPHGGSKAPRVSFHVVALHRVELVGAIIASHHKDVIPQ